MSGHFRSTLIFINFERPGVSFYIIYFHYFWTASSVLYLFWPFLNEQVFRSILILISFERPVEGPVQFCINFDYFWTTWYFVLCSFWLFLNDQVFHSMLILVISERQVQLFLNHQFSPVYIFIIFEWPGISFHNIFIIFERPGILFYVNFDYFWTSSSVLY